MTKQELAAKIWETANALRKNIKAQDYKDYILGFMFYKYLSDKEIDFVKAEGGTIEDLKDTSKENIKYFQDKLGYFISYDDLFSTWQQLKLKLGAQTVSKAIETFYNNLNDRYARCFYVYNKEVDKHSGVFDSLDSGLSKLGENAGSRDRAVRDIVNLVAQIPPKSKEYDVLGYVYEYLIKQFSSEAKKDGAFYTPAGLTQLMARIVADRLKGRKNLKIYDPCVGTAGLLMNVGREASKNTDPDNITYYGQDLITETSNLAKMNLFMQDIPVQHIIVRNANTLEEDWPYFDENTEYSPLFTDAVVANPPYSVHWDPDDYQTDERFRQYGLAPAGKADLAFLLHCLYHVKPDGIMAIVLPHGVLFRGGNEKEIRRNLIENHNIETIIGLPSGMFFSTPIAVIVMILSKNRAADDVLFIDASQCYVKEKTQNVLTESDIQKIYDAVEARKDIPHFAKLVSRKRIIEEDYNLNISRYVSSRIDEAPYDLFSVMTGKIDNAEIDAFEKFWTRFPMLREKLFKAADPGYSTFSCDDAKVVVKEDADVKEFQGQWNSKIEKLGIWLNDLLIKNDSDSNVAEDIREKIFSDLGDDALVDKYAIYQAFANLWTPIDADLARIRTEGKQICREIEPNVISKKNSKTKEYEDVVKGTRGKIIPLDMIKAEYFADELAQVNSLEEKVNQAESIIADAFNNLEEDDKSAIAKDDDPEKYDAKKLTKAIKEGGYDHDTMDQYQTMQTAIKYEKTFKKQIKAVDKDLEERAEMRITQLTDAEVDAFLAKKWIVPIKNAIESVVDSVINGFADDIEALRKKYAEPLSDLSKKEKENGTALKTMLGDLTGNDTDMQAIQSLMEEL